MQTTSVTKNNPMTVLTALSAAAALGCLAFALSAAPVQAKPLNEELQHLLQTHPRLKAAQKGISSAEEGIREAQAGYFPRVNLSGDVGQEYVDSPSRRSTQGEDFFDTRRSTTLTVTQNLFEGFRTSAGEKIAELQKDVSSVRFAIARQTVLFDGIRAYLNLLKQSKLLEIAKRNEQTIQKQLDLESARVERGSGLAVDVLQAKSRLQLARERVVSILGDLRNAHSVYLELFDRPAAPSQMVIQAVPAGLLPETQDGALSMAVQDNPVLKQSKNAVEIASERRTVEQSTFWPRIDLVGEGSWEQNVDGVPGVRREGQVTVRAVWDIFDGFLTPARSSRAAVDYSAALDGRRNVDRDVRNRVRQAWSRYQTTSEQRDLLENARHFLTLYAREEGKAFTGFTEAAEDILLAFDWPGNLREMQNVMRQIVVLNDGELVDPDMLPPPLNINSPAPATMRPASSTKPAPAPDAEAPVAATGGTGSQDMVDLAGKIRPMAEIEREVIENAIDQCNGNIRKAAALLGISAPRIYRKKAVWDES
jgi:outer membrane protein, adhesin transport system